MTENRLRQIQKLGQAIWLDNLSREHIDSGELQRLIEEDGLSGITSNPTIFEKAIGHSERYEEAFAQALADAGPNAREIFLRLAIADIRDAADLLRPVFERTGGQDGYVSFELPPEAAYDTEQSIDLAIALRKRIDRQNALIKVPGTEQGVRAFEELTARGHSINVTLLFSVARYEQIAEAYVRALQRRVDAGEPVDRIASVASFFVSRVDATVDEALAERGRQDLAGRAAVANARVAYESFRRIFSGEAWEAVVEHGANVQRPLWASMSTKNPDYPDTLYVDAMIGPETVNTMPDNTFAAARDHATAKLTISHDPAGAHDTLAAIRDAGVDFDDIVCRQLVEEGVDAFAASFDSLIETIERKATTVSFPPPAQRAPRRPNAPPSGKDDALDLDPLSPPPARNEAPESEPLEPLEPDERP